MGSSHLTAPLLLALMLVLPTAARANGRFPSAQQLVVSPGDPQRISVQATYGFLHSFDGGATWSWTCEEAAFYGGDYDPGVALLASGVLIAGVVDGLVQVSSDACTYALAGGAVEGRWVVDVSRSPSANASAILVASDVLGVDAFQTSVFRTTNDGASWSAVGADLPPNFHALTLDEAASNDQRIYVSGLRVASDGTGKGEIASTLDGGLTWATFAVPFSDETAPPFIGALNPTDPDELWVRLAGNAGILLNSTNGGLTFQKVFDGNGPLLALALSPDGSEIVVGGEVDGLHRASTADLVFSRISDVDARCATWTEAGLWVCADQATAGFSIGLSTDRGVTYTGVHRMGCLSGPVECGPGSATETACDPRWASQKQLLGACEEGGGGASPSDGGGIVQQGGSCSMTANRDSPGRPVEVLPWAAVAFALRYRRRRGSAK